MGQPIVVTELPTTRAGIVRFELNRSLTGMGHERYAAGQEIPGHRPPDEVARRLLQRDGVAAVHIYSNEVTVELNAWSDTEGLKEAIESLYTHYTEGVTPSIP
jgi:hypothetical protein